MSAPFLLCDPALLLPPGRRADERDYQTFWARLIEWAADRRLRMGSESHAALMNELAALGWPDMKPPRCPQALTRDAARALNSLLTVVAVDPPGDAQTANAAFDPAYVRDEALGDAIARDVKTHNEGPLLGAATEVAHWEREVDVVAVLPGPPYELHLVTEPGGSAPFEADFAAASHLKTRRITIVGGREVGAVCADLCERFKITHGQIRWIEAEKGSQPELDRLKGMSGDRDVVLCVTGRMGHAGSDKARRLARASGVRIVCVERTGEIADALQALFSEL